MRGEKKQQQKTGAYKKRDLTVCACLLQFHEIARPEESFAMHREISLFISILISVPPRRPSDILDVHDP